MEIIDYIINFTVIISMFVTIVWLKILWGYFFVYIEANVNKNEPSKSPSISTYAQKCMQWQKWQKIASLWQFELDATRGPLETRHFGEIGDFGESRQRAGVNGEKRPGPFETGDLGENSHFGENRQRAGDNRKTSRPLGDWRFGRK